MHISYLQLIPTLLGAISLASCQNLKQASKTLEASAVCAHGSPYVFSLEKLAVDPQLSSIKFPQTYPWRFNGPTLSHNIQLDVCFDAAGVYPAQLKAITLVDNSISQTQTTEIHSSDSVQGLDEALFGDSEKLDIRVRLFEDDGIVIKGWKDGDRSIVTVAPASFVGEDFTINSILLLTGSLVNAKPFSGNFCKTGETASKTAFILGTASFDASLCTFMGGGETTGYTIKKLVVVDSNPALPSDLRAARSLEGDALAKALKSQWNHHNACDSFVLTLEGVTYAATSAAAAGCGTTLPGAPSRNFQDKNWSTLYTTKYNKQKQSPVAEMDYAHYIFPGLSSL